LKDPGKQPNWLTANGGRRDDIMHRTIKGLRLGIAMFLGALMLTGLLAAGLQDRAQVNRSRAGSYSPPDDGAIVDPSGWPVGERKDRPANEAARRERTGSRLASTPANAGA
jgi:hypothetical protein